MAHRAAEDGLGSLGSLPPVDRLHAYDHVYEGLRKLVLSRKIGPDTHLVESDIAARLGVSRTPVRDALRRLEGEGLARRAQGRGLVAAPMSVEDVSDIFLIRIELDGLAARLACQRAKPGDWNVLRDETERMRRAIDHHGVGSRDFAEAHTTLHRAIYQIAFSSPVASLLNDRVMAYIEIAAELSYTAPEPTRPPVDQHVVLVDALASGDADQAAAVAQDHVHQSAEDALRQPTTGTQD